MDFGKIISAFLAASVTSYLLNRFSLSGVDFALLGVDSETIKSTISGALSAFFVGLTPKNIVEDIKNAILFFRKAKKEIKEAVEQPLSESENK